MARILPVPETASDVQVASRADDPLLRTRQVAEKLSISLRTFQRYVSSGEFPVADLRKKRIVRWKSSTVSLWIETCSNTTNGRAAS